MSVLLRLALWQLKNTLRDALTDPRKLIPLVLVALAAAGYVYIVLYPPADAPAPMSLLAGFLTHRAEAHAAFFLVLSLLMAALLTRSFVGGTLTYSQSDTDYLFLAPFRSRFVLGYKLLAPAPGILLVVLYNVLHGVFRHPAGPAPSALPAWVPVAAFSACTGGYQNLAVALDLVYGLGRSVQLRRAFLTAMALLAAYVIFRIRQHGLAGLAGAAEHGLLPFLFYPCRLAADVALAAGAAKGWLAGGQLAFFYLLTLALVLVPDVNFHEAATGRAARAQQALVTGQWWFRPGASRRPRAPMSLPPFGEGDWAVVWAHLPAAAKNPLGNFAAPGLVGAGLALAALRSPPEVGGLLVSIAALYYLLGTTVGGLFCFRRACCASLSSGRCRCPPGASFWPRSCRASCSPPPFIWPAGCSCCSLAARPSRWPPASFFACPLYLCALACYNTPSCSPTRAWKTNFRRGSLTACSSCWRSC